MKRLTIRLEHKKGSILVEVLKSAYIGEKSLCVYNIEDFPISQKDTSENHTGTWRTLQPVFEEGIAPCSEACPTHTHIPKYMRLFREGDVIAALEVIRQENPLPAVCGRVCPHFCESKCNRGIFDEKLNIRAVERFIGDYGLGIPPGREDEVGKGKNVAVVGSGPAGLSASYFLARHGVSVDIYEREAKAGGLLRYGIPEYRLPRNIVDREIENIFSLGVNFIGGQVIRPDEVSALGKDYDYIFFSPGLWGRNIPDWRYKGKGVYDGLSVLRNIHAENVPDLGEKIAVVGGGNTALDVSRVLTRLGKEVMIVYRRTLDEAPAFEDEVREALEEQIQILQKRLITGIEALDDGTLKIEIQGVSKKEGRIIPNGEKVYRTVDSVVAAVGQVAEIAMEHDEKIIFGGDFETGEGTVVQAIASGKRAALTVLRNLGVLSRNERTKFFRAGTEINHQRVVGYEQLNTAFFSKRDRFELKRRDPSERIADFGEVVEGASLGEILAEAERCLSCGTCTLCRTCWYFCPDACVIISKTESEKVFFDKDFCKGCGICSAVCPTGCIVMEEE
ncbi:MAG: FAD-dependent oxidoreductase [Deltaproteobacteria bacterium]|nr:FAD-dependent oxidoreductase [Deltaproteobacteria bacterium]